MVRVRGVTVVASAMLAAVLGAAPACSGGSSGRLPAAGAGGSAGSPDAGVLFGAGATVSMQIPDGSACVAQVRKGEALPLDMYVLLDRSASMLDGTATGVSKWDAIRSALESFVTDPASAGLSVGLQYFPLMKDGVPSTCTTHAACGQGGPCFITACSNASSLVPCVADAECNGGKCVPFGACETYPSGGSPVYCAPMGAACRAGYGNCIDFPDRWCINGVDCRSASYATPAVPIVELSVGASQIVDSIRATAPDGRTPTAPALSGAIAQASSWAGLHAGHKVVAVLATDGLPTECSPTGIGQVAALAKAGIDGAPSISTFVIGVFAPTDVDSPTNLHTIALAGGTGLAFIVDTGGNVTKEFQDALTAIRGSALLSCDLKLPAEGTTEKLAYSRVNLELVPASGARRQLVYVSNETGCAGAQGTGWYYDADPAAGGTPTKITVCPDVCQEFQGSVGASLNLQIGCQTIVR
jgi:hypothetical protein